MTSEAKAIQLIEPTPISLIPVHFRFVPVPFVPVQSPFCVALQSALLIGNPRARDLRAKACDLMHTAIFGMTR